jgi:hypothetical protein
MSRGFDFDSFEMDDFRESDSYGLGREIGAGTGGGSLSGTSVRLYNDSSQPVENQFERSSLCRP